MHDLLGITQNGPVSRIHCSITAFLNRVTMIANRNIQQVNTFSIRFLILKYYKRNSRKMRTRVVRKKNLLFALDPFGQISESKNIDTYCLYFCKRTSLNFLLCATNPL